MRKRAAIYVRVSTEKQAEKASPLEQEKACRTYCDRLGYIVAAVYKDVEKYRVGKRQVEPSGTRADRPQMRRMLADCEAGQFDVIIAWREDRLYRGLRPMLEVIECLERTKITVELVTETFDSKMAPIKAAIARMELDAIKERHALGRAGRLASGKVQAGHVAFGYHSVDGYAQVCPEEAKWVQCMFEWYVEGLGLREIRRRLILRGAPQRKANNFGQGTVQVDWAIPIIQRYLNYEVFWTGKQYISTRQGQTFEIKYPILIDAELAEGAKKRRTMTKQHPAHHEKHPFLVNGYAYCKHCGVKLQAKSRMRSYTADVSRSHLVLTYSCKYFDIGYQDTNKMADCCRTCAAARLDTAAWEKIWAVLADDVFFENLIEAKIAALRGAETDAEAAIERLQAALDNFDMERHRIVTWARKGTISEQDLAYQLGELELEEGSVRSELQEKSLLVGNRASKLREFLTRYRAELRQGLEALSQEPPSPTTAAKLHEIKRAIVDSIVRRVEVLPDKSCTVFFEFDLPGADIEGGSITPSLCG